VVERLQVLEERLRKDSRHLVVQLGELEHHSLQKDQKLAEHHLEASLVEDLLESPVVGEASLLEELDAEE